MLQGRRVRRLTKQRWRRWGQRAIESPMTPDTSKLGELTVLTPDGVPTPVGEAWRSTPAVLVWLRHFG